MSCCGLGPPKPSSWVSELVPSTCKTISISRELLSLFPLLPSGLPPRALPPLRMQLQLSFTIFVQFLDGWVVLLPPCLSTNLIRAIPTPPSNAHTFPPPVPIPVLSAQYFPPTSLPLHLSLHTRRMGALILSLGSGSEILIPRNKIS